MATTGSSIDVLSQLFTLLATLLFKNSYRLPEKDVRDRCFVSIILTHIMEAYLSFDWKAIIIQWQSDVVNCLDITDMYLLVKFSIVFS